MGVAAQSLTRFERWCGRDMPPVVRTEARAGPLTAELEPPDLRYVRAGDVELVRRLFVAVRDRNWGTVEPALSNVELVEEPGGGFELLFDGRYVDQALGVDLSGHGEVVGAADGTLTCTFEGVANAAFEYNRIGWCILHPAEVAGLAYRARTRDGWVSGSLPTLIGPQSIVDGLPAPLFPSFTELELDLGDGRSVRLEVEGDEFETEDQRNWTDASFKTYSTPLALGFPHRAEKGWTVRQVVRISVVGLTPVQRASADEPVSIRLGEVVGRVPAVGLGASSLARPLSEREALQLAGLRPAHLRVDVDPADPAWRETLEREAAVAGRLGAPLELAVFDGPALEELAAAVRSAAVPLVRVLAFAPGEPTTPPATVERVRALLGENARVYGGTNILFTDLNANRPELGAPEGIAWPLNATVHASDDTSVLETPTTHGESVRSARAFCGDLPLAVTPVTINQRFNAVATGPEPEPPPGQLPPAVDRRQPSLAGAAWTLASAKHLAEAGAGSVTYFETVGWRGVVESDEGSPAPELFRSLPDSVYPLYHVLADLGELRDAEVLAARSSSPLAVTALALLAAGRLTLLVANLTPAPQRCRIDGVAGGRLRRLDEHTFLDACTDPASFRASTAPLDGPELELAPFAVVRIDVSP